MCFVGAKGMFQRGGQGAKVEKRLNVDLALKPSQLTDTHVCVCVFLLIVDFLKRCECV